MKTLLITQIKSIPCIWAAGLLALGGAAISDKALAAEPMQPLVTIVGYGDLKVDSEEGAKVLYARLRSAAQNVCFPLKDREIGRETAWQKCFDKALASAVTQVNKPRVTALHNHAAKGSIEG